MILLDTHVLVWSVLDSPRLSRRAAAAIRRARSDGGVAIAGVTLWELARLFERGQLRMAGTIQSAVEALAAEVAIQPVTAAIAALAAQLGRDYPADPMDRIIGATALANGWALVTHDEQIRQSRLLATIW